MKKALFPLFAIVSMVMIGCATTSTYVGTEKVVETSREKPKYLKQGVESNVSKDPVWFIGIGEAVDLSYARRLAESKARLAIERSYSARLDNILENAQLINDNKAVNAGREIVKSATTANTVAVRLAESYWEKIEKNEGKSRSTRYRVYARVECPKKIYEKNLMASIENRVLQAEESNDTETYETASMMLKTLKMMME